MMNTQFSRVIFFTIIFGIVYLSQASALSTRDRILSGIRFSQGDQYSIITVSFNFPVRYLRHYPLEVGNEVRIQFDPILTTPEEREGLNKRESLFPPASNPAGVKRVEYEGSDLIEPSIRVVFDDFKQFEARQGDDFRSLKILIPVEKEMVEPTEKAEPPVSMEKQPDVTQPVATKPTTPGPGIAQPGALSEEREKSLIEEGEKVMAEENYDRAIQVYTKLLESGNEETRELAQFQLAYARQLNGHIAHAKAEYRNYLSEFPGGPRAEEARENLRTILSAQPARLGSGPNVLGKSQSLWQNEFFGSLSVTYERDDSFLTDEEADDEDEEIVTNVSSLITDFDATWRMMSDRYTIEAVAIGSYENDFVEGRDNETRSSALYVDFEDTAEDVIRARLGRQSTSKGGVLGRFDGGMFGYRVLEKVRINLVAGFPVDRSSDGLETDRYFYGINFDLGRYADHWDFNTYFINQVSDSIDDRRAVGAEIRYVGRQGSFFTLLDYDLIFDDVSIFLFAGNYLLPNDKTRINFSADFRNSPVLSTTNALIGQTTPSLEELVDRLGEDAVRELARDRSLESSFVSLGLSHPLTDNIQIAADVSWSKLDGAPASGGVPEFESTGDEFYYSLQLIGNGIIKDGDLSNLALRYADTQTRDTYTFILNSRYPINEMWRINPKLQVDYRSNKLDDGDQWRFRPALRLECILGNNWRFEIEGEYSWANQLLTGLAEDKEGYAISVGLRWDF